eukprot:756844-Hanusia_phi.AAC.1
MKENPGKPRAQSTRDRTTHQACPGLGMYGPASSRGVAHLQFEPVLRREPRRSWAALREPRGTSLASLKVAKEL